MKGVLLAIVLLAGSGGPSNGYSNLSGPGVVWNWAGSSSTPEVGDLVTLAGSERKLQSVTFCLGCVETQPNGTVDVTVRARALDPATGLPGAVLSTATKVGVAYTGQSFQLTVNMPSVTLPDQVFVTAQMSNGTQTAYGVVARRGTPVGSSDSEEFYVCPSGGTWVKFSGQGVGNGNLALAVTVGP